MVQRDGISGWKFVAAEAIAQGPPHLLRLFSVD